MLHFIVPEGKFVLYLMMYKTNDGAERRIWMGFFLLGEPFDKIFVHERRTFQKWEKSS